MPWDGRRKPEHVKMAHLVSAVNNAREELAHKHQRFLLAPRPMADTAVSRREKAARYPCVFSRLTSKLKTIQTSASPNEPFGHVPGLPLQRGFPCRSPA